MKETLKQLVINIVQIVTYPLAIIAFQFATLLMLIDPYTGRIMWGSIENLWIRNGEITKVLIPTIPIIKQFGFLNYILTDCPAPCMQPRIVWVQRNLYRYIINNDDTFGYKEKHIRSRLHDLGEECRIYETAVIVCQSSNFYRLFNLGFHLIDETFIIISVNLFVN